MQKQSLRSVFMLGVFLSCTIPFILGCLYVQLIVSNEAKQDFEKTAFEAIERVYTSVDSQTKPAYSLITMLARDTRTIQLIDSIGDRIIADPSQLAPDEYQHLAAFAQAHSENMGIALGTSQGGYIEYPDFFSKSGFDPRTRPWYKEAVLSRGQPYATNPYIRSTGEYTMAVVRTVDRGNDVAGVIVFGWNLQNLQHEVEKINIGKNGYVVVLNQNDKIIASPKHPEWLMKTPYELNLPGLMYLEDRQAIAGRGNVKSDGEVMYFDVFPETGWKVVAIFDKSALGERVGERLYPILYIYCVTMLCVLLSIYLLAQKKVIEPINCLTNGAQAIADNSNYISISIPGNNEFSILASSFNKMVFALKRNIDKVLEQNLEIRKRKREFQTLVENAQDVIFRLSRTGNILYANPVTENYTGMSLQWLIGRHVKDCGFSDLFESTVRNVVEGKEPGGSLEIDLVNQSREVEYFNAHIIPEYNDAQTVETVLCVLRNVTHEKFMKKEMIRLDRLNTIGEIAAAIAHEVRNPMTTVRGFLQFLGKKENDCERKSFYDLMIEELDRANEIITEFLSLARNKTIKLSKTNLNNVINAMAPLIRADALMAKRNLHLDLGDIPDLELDAKEMRQLILNLARNGLEAMTAGGTLTISTYKDKENVVLKISDQGSGINPEMLKNLGMPFLTTKENGTGLGLAVCYSIIERHKARVDVESGHMGTSFYIRFCI